MYKMQQYNNEFIGAAILASVFGVWPIIIYRLSNNLLINAPILFRNLYGNFPTNSTT